MPRSPSVQRRRRRLPVSKRVKDYFYIILALDSASDEIRRSAMRNAPKDLLLALTEIAQNIAAGHGDLDDSEYARLSKYASAITKVINKKTSLVKKKQLYQEGGFLGALAAPLLSSIVPQLIGSVVSNIIPSPGRRRSFY